MSGLRQRAEERLAKAPGPPDESVRDLQRTVHDLHVHEIELEIQNEELRRAQIELQEARDRYFDLYDLAPVGYATLNRSGVIQEANLTLANLLELPRARLVGRNLASVLRREDTDRFHGYREQIFSGEPGKKSLEVSMKRLDGTEVPVLLESTPALIGGTVATCRTAVIDLSAKRRVEDELRDREARLSAILDTAVDGIITIDASGTVETFNPAAARIFGYTPEEVIGRPIAMLMPESHRPRYRLYIARYLQRSPEGIVGTSREVWGQRKDGSIFPIELAVGEQRGEHARKFVGVVRDVTERRQKDEQLRETLARFQQIAERIEDVFYIAEPSTGRYSYLSPACREIFGWAPERAAADAPAWLSNVHPEDRARVSEALGQVRQEAAVFDEEYRLVRTDGSVRLVRDRAFPLRSEDRVTGIVQDVTEERRLEAELRQAQRMEAVGTLASGIAHDFNNLLMGLAGFASMALKSLDHQHPAYAYVERSMQATMRGASLTRQLVGFSGRKRPASGPTIEVDAAVAEAKELIERLVGEHIRVAVETGAPGLRIAAEPGDIEQVLMNLASNARDAMAGGGTLTIKTCERPATDGGGVVLNVRDMGHGMDEATKARIFEPFFTTKAVGSGTGLGLSTVFGAVRRLAGHISVESALGQGTEVSIHFPVADRGIDRAHDAGAVPSGHETVLLVEDDALVRITVQSYLESLGYRVLVASDGAQAVAIANEKGSTIDVLLTDVVMPGRLGGELARELREKYPALKVLYMSAHPASEHVRLGRIDKSEPLLGKPFDQTALGFALHELITGLPAVDDAPVAPPQMTVARRSARRGAIRAARAPIRSVLVVDDNPDIADALREALAFDGRHVAIASSGAEAIRIARELRPDAVLCDLELGRMSGYDVARTLRAAPELGSVFLVAVTGFSQADCRAAALESGFDDILTKPIGLQDLEDLLGPVPADLH